MDPLMTSTMGFFKASFEMQKNMLNQTHNALMAFQDQAEKMTNSIIDQATWMPEETRNALKAWMGNYNKFCADCTKMMTSSIDSMEKFIAQEKGES